VLDKGGHLTYLKNNEWILNDTYPKAFVVSRRHTSITSPAKAPHRPRQLRATTGIQRRMARGQPSAQQPRRTQLVCIDSPHTGEGRQLFVIDIRGIA
jgi:hypothetical protein